MLIDIDGQRFHPVKYSELFSRSYSNSDSRLNSHTLKKEIRLLAVQGEVIMTSAFSESNQIHTGRS